MVPILRPKKFEWSDPSETRKQLPRNLDGEYFSFPFLLQLNTVR